MDEEETPEQQSDTSPEDVGGDSEPATPEEGGGDEDGSNLSLYNFDLQSVEGVDRLMALLPILDEDIVKAVYQECFPGYPLDSIAPRMARIELRGFFMDYLDGENAA